MCVTALGTIGVSPTDLDTPPFIAHSIVIDLQRRYQNFNWLHTHIWMLACGNVARGGLSLEKFYFIDSRIALNSKLRHR